MPLGFFPLPLSTPFQYLRPSADSSDGSWTDQAGGTSLFAAIDEVVADDTNYIKSGIAPQNDIAKIKLSPPASPVAQLAKVTYRYWNEGGHTDLLVRLMQDTTQIVQWTHTNIASNTTLQATQILTTEQFNAITNWADLYLEFEADSP